MTVNHDVVGSSPTGGVLKKRSMNVFFIYVTKLVRLAPSGEVHKRVVMTFK